MHPQLFLKEFWQMNFRPQVFVAMSFHKNYDERFERVITPAIKSIKIDDVELEPYRVDISKSGDSILTDIIDGIAHSQLVLADVSSIGLDSEGKSYRNANVMYEVGLAIACRQPTEVLLIRDDGDKFLFDVSTIPHVTIDFTKHSQAIDTLMVELSNRLKERKLIDDTRVRIAAESLTVEEISTLSMLCRRGILNGDESSDRVLKALDGCMDSHFNLSRLLDMKIIRRIAKTENDKYNYVVTQFGRAVNLLVSQPVDSNRI